MAFLDGIAKKNTIESANIRIISENCKKEREVLFESD